MHGNRIFLLATYQSAFFSRLYHEHRVALPRPALWAHVYRINGFPFGRKMKVIAHDACVVEVAEGLFPYWHDFGGKATVGKRHACKTAGLQDPVNFLEGLGSCTKKSPEVIYFVTFGLAEIRFE